MSTLVRFLKVSQKAGYDALAAKAKRIWAELDLIWEGVPTAPSFQLSDALRNRDEVDALRAVAELCDKELSDKIIVTGEVREELIELKGECLGLALWIEGRL